MPRTAPRDTINNALGLGEAANLAGVTHQTIRNWASNGIIRVGTNPDILSAMNDRKSGRKHQRYYYRDEVARLANVAVTPDLISADEAAQQLGVTIRTLRRIRDRQNLPAYVGPSYTIYLRREDIDKQVKGVTYYTNRSEETDDDDD